MRLGNGTYANILASVLGCKFVALPIKYLGLLLGAKYKEVPTWDLVIIHFDRCWLGGSGTFYRKGEDLLSSEV